MINLLPNKRFFLIRIFFQYLFFITLINAQTSFPADPYDLLSFEREQFQKKLPFNTNNFKPYYFKSDTSLYSISLKSEAYFNNGSPNQENMDVRYFSKGLNFFNSFNFTINNKYILFSLEPYILSSNNYDVETTIRNGSFSVLNDQNLDANQLENNNIRNFLFFPNFKGFGFGLQKGNRWWGPGIHSSFQMSNNTSPITAKILGTMKEFRIKNIGLYALYSFSKLNKQSYSQAKYLTSLNASISLYSSLNISLGFSRNYLTGGKSISNYVWKESDARKIIFEGLLTSNLIREEYTIGGHDYWDQTLSTFISVVHPKKHYKAYIELGFNDNRMYLADLISQPDHSMSTIFGFRNYEIGPNGNWLWGFEWINLMITYSSRHRPTGTGAWYTKPQYNYSSYNGRRWGAHSGTDSDDWYLYFGYVTNNFSIVPSFNYERHGIVIHRPAEVKFEFKLDSRIKYKDTWFGLIYERQYEAFLGFPDFFYTDRFGKQIDSSNGRLANSKIINTLIISFNKSINL